MADLILSLTIPGSKVPRTIQRLVAHLPNTETKDDPNWVDPEDGSQPDQVAKYTDEKWIKQNMKYILKMWDRKGMIKIAEASADKSDMFEE